MDNQKQDIQQKQNKQYRDGYKNSRNARVTITTYYQIKYQYKKKYC